MTLVATYRNRPVLVTGHTGFKGAWLCMWLKHLGANVTGYALPPDDRRQSLYRATRLAEHITSIHGDVRDFSHLAKVVQEFQPEVVFHLAAQSLVGQSYRNPMETFQTNVMGTVALLEAVRRVPSVRSCVIVTSDKCYQKTEKIRYGYREGDPLGGHDPYSASKACAEIVAASYHTSFLMANGLSSLATARSGNAIGGGDWSEERLVPDILRALETGQSVVLRNPNAVRPWQHVLEPLYGYLLLGERLLTNGREFSGSWNFGPNPSGYLSVRELTFRLTKAWGSPDHPIRVIPGNFYEAEYLNLDPSKAQAKLGWCPLLDVEERVQYVVKWHRGYLQKPTLAADLILAQVDEVMKRVPICVN